jgi:hypothetical protein
MAEAPVQEDLIWTIKFGTTIGERFYMAPFPNIPVSGIFFYKWAFPDHLVSDGT